MVHISFENSASNYYATAQYLEVVARISQRDTFFHKNLPSVYDQLALKCTVFTYEQNKSATSSIQHAANRILLSLSP